MQSYTVHLTAIRIQTSASSSEAAVAQVLAAENAPESAVLGVYLDNPVPKVNCRYGAPQGRVSANLDPDGRWEAKALDLDEGYDDGGAYWGMRQYPMRLFAVQDGMGNIAYVDATCSDDALTIAAGEPVDA